jgi:tetratricopeptide (TPR) repeat protein
MMKLSLIIRRDSVIYTLLFVAWAVIIYCVNAHYAYFGTPVPSVSFGAQQSPAAAVNAMTDTIARQMTSLSSENNPAKRGRIFETIGATYYRLYVATRKRAYLDSSFEVCSNELRENGKASSAYLLLGQIMREKKEFAAAQSQLEKAISCEPRSALLEQTLGILLWFDLKRPDLARPHFERALGLDSSFPTAHYVLGVIALDKNDFATARDHFENELRIYNALSASASRKVPPVDPSDVRMAACFSSLRLAFLYSTTFVDAQKAQDRFNVYTKLETDPQRRQASINDIQKYWKTSQPGSSLR